MSQRRQDLFKKKVEERLEKAKELLKDDSNTTEVKSRKRGLTHFGMAELQQTKEELERSKQLIRELEEKLHQAQVSANEHKAFNEAVGKGTLLAELSPEQIIVSEHDRNEIALKEPEFDQLVSSIQESGQLIPIVVRPIGEGQYELIAGFRRLNACKQLNRSVIASIMKADDTQAQILKTIENHVRTDLTVFERAESYVNIIDRLKLTTVRGLAKKLGVGRSEVSRYYRIGKYIPADLKRLLEVVEPAPSDTLPANETIKRTYPAVSHLEKIVDLITDLDKNHNISAETIVERITSDFIKNKNHYGNNAVKRAQRIIAILTDWKRSLKTMETDTESKREKPDGSLKGFIYLDGKQYPVHRRGKRISIEADSAEEASKIEKWLTEKLFEHDPNSKTNS